MNDINHVTLSGHLTRDAELRMTQSGFGVLSFGIAVNESVKDRQTGEWEDRPNFFDGVIFGKRAEALQNRMKKGMQVSLDGSLRYTSWETQDKQKRSRVEVVADKVVLPPMPKQPATQPQNQSDSGFPVYDVDIPF